MKPPKSSSELTFTGKEYFLYEMPSDLGSLVTTYEEEFTIDFKTSRSTGLLAYAGMFNKFWLRSAIIISHLLNAGDAQDYFVLGLQDGALYFKLNIKGQQFEKTLTLSGTYLHNNQWHSVRFARKIRHVSRIICIAYRQIHIIYELF